VTSPIVAVDSRRSDPVICAARWVLGAVFIYLGVIKALHPVDFLKIVRQYDVFENHVALNVIAAVLPWFEIFCGLLLVCGIARRGSALALLAMLIPFTGIVFRRAWLMHHEQGTAFCAVRFDCGCGTGEVLICGKLLENALLILLCLIVIVRRCHRTPM
jgi:uncharacterized membrane protein YphA (DoxX/SURF4 family)